MIFIGRLTVQKCEDQATAWGIKSKLSPIEFYYGTKTWEPIPLQGEKDWWCELL